MNRYKIALGKEQSITRMAPELEERLRKGAVEWMATQKRLVDGLPQGEFDELARKAFKAHKVASKLFPSSDIFSDACIQTAADFMHLSDEKLEKIIDYIKSGK